jgi:hypothetical protein
LHHRAGRKLGDPGGGRAIAHPVEIEHNRRANEARQIAIALQGQPARVLSEMLLQLDGRSPGTLDIAARYAALDPHILRATGGDKFVPGPAVVAEKK